MGKASVMHRGAAGHLVSLPCALEEYVPAGSGQLSNLTAVQEPFFALSDAGTRAMWLVTPLNVG